MSLYSVIKKTYHAVVPGRVRSGLYRILPGPLKMTRVRLIRALGRFAGHDELYDAQYYAGFEAPGIERSYEVIADTITELFGPACVVDVGCGVGKLLAALRCRGVPGRGLEYASVALDACRTQGLDVAAFDLERDVLPEDLRADLVVSTEVAEHLPAACADRFVATLCAVSDRVLMTAAPPATTWRQAMWGRDHVNEQLPRYWIAKFAERDYTYDADTTEGIRQRWQNGQVSPWFIRGVMVFRRTRPGGSDAFDGCST